MGNAPAAVEHSMGWPRAYANEADGEDETLNESPVRNPPRFDEASRFEAADQQSRFR
jgi:hypothetical protein